LEVNELNKSINVVLLISLLIFCSTHVHADPPFAQTDPESLILSSSQVLVKGWVNPGGLATTVVFDYGTTTSYGNQVTAFNSPTGPSTGTLTLYGVIEGLSPGAG
jgi:hypothetical protein